MDTFVAEETLNAFHVPGQRLTVAPSEGVLTYM